MNKRKFDIKAFETLPKSLRPSDYIDFLQFFIYEKSCIRLGLNKKIVYDEMILWCKKNRYKYLISEHNLMYISRFYFISALTKIIDNSTFNHAYILGKFFGYPNCCSKKIARIGENKIDDYEKEFIDKSDFNEKNIYINPKGYIKGYALISHIPCSPDCKKSLKKAKKALLIIEQYKDHPTFQKWQQYWLK